MILALPDLLALGVTCDGVFPLTTWVNFTDQDERSPAYKASFCIEVQMTDPRQPVLIAPRTILEARDRKRREFAVALPEREGAVS